MNEDETTLSLSNRSASHPDADRPRRSLRAWLFRPWVLVSFLAALLLLSAPFAYRGWVLSQVPDIDLPYDTQPIFDLVVPDKNNAWVEFRQATALVVPMDAATGKAFNAAAMNNFDSPSPLLLTWLAQNRPALEIWKKGTEKSDAQYLIAKQYAQGRPFHPWYTADERALREIIDAATLETSQLLILGRTQDAWSLCRAQIRASDLYRRHGNVELSEFSGTSMSVSRGAVVEWIQSEHVSVAQLRHAQHELQHSLRPRPWVKEMVQLDGATLLRIDEEFRTDPEYCIDQVTSLPASVELFIRGEPTIDKRVRRLAIANFLQGCHGPPRSRPKVIGKLKLFDLTIHSAQASVTVSEIERCAQCSSLTLGETYPDATISKWWMLYSSDREQLLHELLIAATAVEAFKRQTGSYPETLNQLVPEFLSEVPENTLALVPTPIVYRRHSAGAELSAEDELFGEGEPTIRLGRKRSKD